MNEGQRFAGVSGTVAVASTRVAMVNRQPRLHGRDRADGGDGADADRDASLQGTASCRSSSSRPSRRPRRRRSGRWRRRRGRRVQYLPPTSTWPVSPARSSATSDERSMPSGVPYAQPIESTRFFEGIPEGCGSSTTSGSGTSITDAGSALGPNSSGLDVAQRFNALIKENYDLRCKLCPCGGFSTGSDLCLGAVFDQYPDAKKHALCEIAAGERNGLCLKAVVDCKAADQCEVVHQSEKAECPVVQVDPTKVVLPPGCTG